MGDINVQAPPRSGDPAADQEHSKAIGREIKEQVRGFVTEMLHE